MLCFCFVYLLPNFWIRFRVVESSGIDFWPIPQRERNKKCVQFRPKFTRLNRPNTVVRIRRGRNDTPNNVFVNLVLHLLTIRSRHTPVHFRQYMSIEIEREDRRRDDAQHAREKTALQNELQRSRNVLNEAEIANRRNAAVVEVPEANFVIGKMFLGAGSIHFYGINLNAFKGLVYRPVLTLRNDSIAKILPPPLALLTIQESFTHSRGSQYVAMNWLTVSKLIGFWMLI